MKKIGSAFENFAFKAFDFSGRATLLEYWLLMPLVWALILFLTSGDLTEMWDFLLRREIPPLNPLYWDGLVVFLLTLIPRMSLTMRRLHDSGKSGKWAKLPFVTVTSGIVLVLGIFSAMATTNAMGGNTSMDLTVIAIFMAIIVGSLDSAWDAIFVTAQAANALGWDAFIALLAEMFAPAQQVNIAQGAANVGDSLRRDPGAEGGAVLVMAIALIATPFVSGFLHVFFMISPSKPDHELDSAAPLAGASLRQKGEVSDDPFAGYRYLYAKTPDQEAAQKDAAKQEINSLYQQRVLGQQAS